MRKVVIAGLLVLGAFVFWHTGSRGGAVCMRNVFVSGAELSFWPPGARCSWGEPARTGVFLNPWFFGTVFALTVLGVALSVRGHPDRVM